jgi:hypothetical protein
MTDDLKLVLFKKWLAKRWVGSSDTSRLARMVARGEVTFDGSDDPETRSMIFRANLEWRCEQAKSSPRRRAGKVCPGCQHPTNVHGNTEEADNVGPCGTPGCDCPGVPDGGLGEDPADNESSKPRRRRPLPVTGKSRSVRRQASPVCPHCRRPGGDLQLKSDKRGQSGTYHRVCFADMRGRPAHIGAAGVYGGRGQGVRTTAR